jgi:hypothetical protein
MDGQKIVNIALENLYNITKIRGLWIDIEKEIDGKITFIQNNIDYVFFAEIKKELRQHQLNRIEQKAQYYRPLIIIAERIFPKIKEELRDKNIAYLEANGNIFINEQNIYLWIDTQKPIHTEKEKTNRAFTKTGLKVLFQFLLDEKLINQTYRDIAYQTGVGFANINYIINGLKEKGFILEIDNKLMKLVNKNDLLKLWIDRFDEKLKPHLHIGNFRFLDKNDFHNWKNIQFKNQDTEWGGEPAAALLTKYLNPEILTLYTLETKTDIMKNYKLVPDDAGNVKVFQKFWKFTGFDIHTAPPLLVYADLINTRDNRNIETANMIFNDYLKDKY